MRKRSKIVFNHEKISNELSLEEIIALITTGERDSAEYGLTLMILRTISKIPRTVTKAKMYDLYMRNREQISKASFYRILTRLMERGMVILDEEGEVYCPSILFSNALQRLATAWERIVLSEDK